jgi:phospholipid/cholesterol/gamma-HCH transport system permease protein
VQLRGASARVVLAGDWMLGTTGPQAADAVRAVQALPAGAIVSFDTRALGTWDSALIAFLLHLDDAARAQRLAIQPDGLPDGARRLLALATAVPERVEARRQAAARPMLDRFGASMLRVGSATGSFVEFVGETALALGRLVTGRAQVRRRDVGLALQQAGIDALPVVSLVNFLMGLILGFVGAAQLKRFGATIFVADLVGIGIVRDLAALMTAVVMSGRSGAAFAAALGTMQTNQEIDALEVAGIAPIDALVLPRVIALTIMTPLLTLYGEALGLTGGAVVSAGMFDVSFRQFLAQAREAVPLKFLTGGLVKALVYGALVALAGCWHGIRSGRSAEAVGRATTSAVVLSIVLIVSAAGLFAYVYDALNL